MALQLLLFVSAACNAIGAPGDVGPLCSATLSGSSSPALALLCRPARFGAASASITGMALAFAKPTQACTGAGTALTALQLVNVDGTPWQQQYVEVQAGGSPAAGGGVAVLVERGGCGFGEKVAAALAVGAGAVLIADNKGMVASAAEAFLAWATGEGRAEALLALPDLALGKQSGATALAAAMESIPVLSLSSASVGALRKLASAAPPSGGASAAVAVSVSVGYAPRWREHTHSEAGLALGVRQQYKSAAAEFRRARKLAPTDAQHAANQGAALMGLVGQAREGKPLPASLLAAAEEALEAALLLGAADGVAHFNLGMLWQRMGRLEDAMVSYQQAHALAVASTNKTDQVAQLRQRCVEGAAAVLKLQGHEKGSAAWISTHFDMYAGWFDDSMSTLEYRGVVELGAGLQTVLAGAQMGLRVLDVGCGTGKVGALLRSEGRAGAVIGCDLSPQMVNATRVLGDYERVVHADGVELLREWADGKAEPPATLDLVTFADVLIYIGEPRPLLLAAARAMRRLGPTRAGEAHHVAFTTEARDPKSTDVRGDRGDLMWKDDQNRFVHADAFIRAEAEAAGFRVALERTIKLRKHRGEWLPGTVFVLHLVE